MKSFTVVGFFEDNGQVWCEHVRAETPHDAMRKSVKQLRVRDNEDMPDDNMAVVGVFTGHRMEISESWAVAYASDLLGNVEGNDGNCADKTGHGRG